MTVPKGMPTESASIDLDLRFEEHRAELVGYCYRMLGSPFEAEDAVQETLLRAWQNADRYDQNRAESPRPWLFTIATNVCLDMLRSTQRRARAMDLGPSTYAGAALGAPLPDATWVLPIPDSRVVPAHGDPAELAAQRETIRLAFVAALQHLPPRQRAVLILRDVLCWQAAEVARLLGTSTPSVNSALQRARSTMTAADIASAESYQPKDKAQQEWIRRYCDAFHRHDMETLVSLLHEDATLSMPPFTWWLRGRKEIERALLAPDASCEGARLVPTAANGSIAFAQYRPSGPGGAFEPFALEVVEIVNGLVIESTTYLDGRRLCPLFGLPSDPEAVAALLG